MEADRTILRRHRPRRGQGNARSARREWATDAQGSGSQRDIRRALIEADLVDCMVALPGQRFKTGNTRDKTVDGPTCKV